MLVVQPEGGEVGWHSVYLPKRVCNCSTCPHSCALFVWFQESHPVFSIKREPGKFYVMMLDRGPRKLAAKCVCMRVHAFVCACVRAAPEALGARRLRLKFREEACMHESMHRSLHATGQPLFPTRVDGRARPAARALRRRPASVLYRLSSGRPSNQTSPNLHPSTN